MRQPFCILIVLGDLLDDGELCLIDTATTLADARTHVEALAEWLPGEYVIYDERTGQRIYVFPGAACACSRDHTNCNPHLVAEST